MPALPEIAARMAALLLDVGYPTAPDWARWLEERDEVIRQWSALRRGDWGLGPVEDDD